MSKGIKFQETKKKLIELSNKAKALRVLNGLDMTINEILLSRIYDIDGGTEFNTFAQWREKGYTVLKGSASFKVWGQPRKNVEKSEDIVNSDNVDEYSFFPVCYLFSDKQVRKLDRGDGEAGSDTYETVSNDNNIDDIL